MLAKQLNKLTQGAKHDCMRIYIVERHHLLGTTIRNATIFRFSYRKFKTFEIRQVSPVLPSCYASGLHWSIENIHLKESTKLFIYL